MSGNGQESGNGQVSDNGQVSGNVEVSGNGKVSDEQSFGRAVSIEIFIKSWKRDRTRAGGSRKEKIPSTSRSYSSYSPQLNASLRDVQGRGGWLSMNC